MTEDATSTATTSPPLATTPSNAATTVKMVLAALGITAASAGGTYAVMNNAEPPPLTAKIEGPTAPIETGLVELHAIVQGAEAVQWYPVIQGQAYACDSDLTLVVDTRTTGSRVYALFASAGAQKVVTEYTLPPYVGPTTPPTTTTPPVQTPCPPCPPVTQPPTTQPPTTTPPTEFDLADRTRTWIVAVPASALENKDEIAAALKGTASAAINGKFQTIAEMEAAMRVALLAAIDPENLVGWGQFGVKLEDAIHRLETSGKIKTPQDLARALIEVANAMGSP